MLTPLVVGEPSVADVLEGETPTYTATIVDDAGAVLPATGLTSLTLTLYVIKSDGTVSYLNSRNAQSVLNANQGTVYNALQTRADGTTYNFQMQFLVADMSLVENLHYERHIALFEWGWTASGVVRAGKHELVLTVKNLTEVP